MSKLERWLTLVANLSVVAGILFLAAEMRQNTQAIRAQTRDSITEKQMDYYSLTATDRPLADLVVRVRSGINITELDATDRFVWGSLWRVIIREWENAYYQYEHGLFAPDEFEARLQTWRTSLSTPAFRQNWQLQRDAFSPDFRAEIDRIVAEVEQAQ